MDRVERFESIIRVAATSSVGAGAIVLHHCFSDALNDHPKGAIALTVVVLAAAVALLEIGVDRLKYIRWVRQHIIYREDWVEGLWFDYLVDPKEKKVLGCAIVVIDFVDGTLKVNGCATATNGTLDALFESEVLRCDQHRMRYMYRKKGGLTCGYAEYNFIRIGKGLPAEFQGWYIEGTSGVKCEVEARRIDNEQLTAELRDMLRRPAAVQRLVEQFRSATGHVPETSTGERARRHGAGDDGPELCNIASPAGVVGSEGLAGAVGSEMDTDGSGGKRRDGEAGDAGMGGRRDAVRG